jgi:hypothetical protein
MHVPVVEAIFSGEVLYSTQYCGIRCATRRTTKTATSGRVCAVIVIRSKHLQLARLIALSLSKTDPARTVITLDCGPPKPRTYAWHVMLQVPEQHSKLAPQELPSLLQISQVPLQLPEQHCSFMVQVVVKTRQLPPGRQMPSPQNSEQHWALEVQVWPLAMQQPLKPWQLPL